MIYLGEEHIDVSTLKTATPTAKATVARVKVEGADLRYSQNATPVAATKSTGTLIVDGTSDWIFDGLATLKLISAGAAYAHIQYFKE